MARPLRIARAGAWYHVTARGTERRRIFADDRDRCRWLDLVAEAIELFGLVVHAYVLMDNHYHLLVETREANLSRALQWLQTSYSMGFNRRFGRVGPLFQGRFKAVIVDQISWGLALSRYLHLNPVRVQSLGLDKRARQADRWGARGQSDAAQVRERVARLRQYRWSSYRAFAGLEQGPVWLNRRAILGWGGGRGNERQRQGHYRQYVEAAIREGLQESPWDYVQAQLVLGGGEFLKKVSACIRGHPREQPQQRALKSRPSWAAVVKAIEQMRGEPWATFRDRHGDWGRDAALYLGRRQGGLSLTELGQAVGGADYSAVSMAIKRFEKRLVRHRLLRKITNTLTKLLNVET